MDFRGEPSSKVNIGLNILSVLDCGRIIPFTRHMAAHAAPEKGVKIGLARIVSVVGNICSVTIVTQKGAVAVREISRPIPVDASTGRGKSILGRE